ncbi:hypothetical protein [Roseococcus sp. YIM B11640]|uniref:hypothetical protein n=1 Tax=Roseococcus sp. YIM B11640 TaxID=3133973 RepID=UPI003C7EB53B
MTDLSSKARRAAKQLAEAMRSKPEKTGTANDLGPKIVDRKGRPRLHPSRVIETAADPAHPNRTIRRARVQWLPDVWLSKGAIEQGHHDAATRFLTAYERGVLGAKDRHLTRISFNRAAPTGLPIAQLGCLSDYRAAEQAVGIMLSGALAWCVLSTGTVEGWAECKGWHRDRASGYLMAALDRLAEHYGYPVKNAA